MPLQQMWYRSLLIGCSMSNMDEYVLRIGTWKSLQRHKKKHTEKGNGFGYVLHTEHDTTKTLSARYYKDGGEILISRGEGKLPRKLTGIECERLQAFPDNWTEGLSNTQRYKCLGNALTTTVVTAILNRLYEEN